MAGELSTWEAVANVLEALWREVECEADAQLIARQAEQWRAQAERQRANQQVSGPSDLLREQDAIRAERWSANQQVTEASISERDS